MFCNERLIRRIGVIQVKHQHPGVARRRTCWSQHSSEVYRGPPVEALERSRQRPGASFGARPADPALFEFAYVGQRDLGYISLTLRVIRFRFSSIFMQGLAFSGELWSLLWSQLWSWLAIMV